MKKKILSLWLAFVFCLTSGIVWAQETPAQTELARSYRQQTQLSGSYWDVFAARSVLDEEFQAANYAVYDVEKHNEDSKWQATDYAAVILELLACGENPYQYHGRNYVQELIDYYKEAGFWGAFANPIWAGLALEAAGADGYDSTQYVNYCKAMLGDLSQGADMAGWSLVVLANHKNDSGVAEAIDAFCEKIKTYQVQDGEYQGLLDTGGMAGSMMSVTTACVVSGLTAIGEDLSSPEWCADGVSMTDALYRTSVQGKKYVHPQIAVAIGDAAYGGSVFQRVAVTREKAEQLIVHAQTLDLSAYAENRAEAVRDALSKLQSVMADAEKSERGAFGEAYFSLHDALNALEQPMNEQEKCEKDARLLAIDADLTHVIATLTLPTAGTHGSVIAWQSSKPEVLAADGTVARQKTDTQVTLTATLTHGETMCTRVFDVCVAGTGAASGGSTAAKEKVRLIVRGDSVHGEPEAHKAYQTWLSASEPIEDGDTVYSVFVRVMKKNNLDFEEKSGYIASVQSPDGTWLAEFDNGRNSGWMYTLNGEFPQESMKECDVRSGDRIEFRYVDDFTKEGALQEESSSGGTAAVKPTATPNASASPVPTEKPVASPSPTVSPLPPSKEGIDIPDSYWARKAVAFLIEREIMDTMENFDAGLTRAEFAKILFALSGEHGPVSKFADVLPNDSYAEAIGWAQEIGIVQGDGEYFFPEQEMTRQDAVVVLCRFCGIDGVDSGTGFVDEDQIADYARGAISTLWVTDRLFGVPGGRFEPLRTITRAETAKLIYELKEYRRIKTALERFSIK